MSGDTIRNLLLREPDVARDQREDRAHRMRRLRGHVDRQLAGDPVEVRHAAAGLDGGDVDAGGGTCPASPSRPLPRTPCPWRPDLPPANGRCGCPSCPSCRCASTGADGVQRLERVHHHRQRLVLDLHRLHAVRRRVPVGGDHRRPPPAPGTSPSRWAAPSGCPTSGSASSAGCTWPGSRR